MNVPHTMLVRLGLFLLTLAALAAPAAAAPVSYFGIDDPRGTLTNSLQAQADFLATLSSYGTDTLEASPTFVANPGLTFAGTSLTATSNSNYIASFGGLYAISGTKFLSDRGPANDTLPGIPDVFTINAPITAFGFFISNGGDAKANSISLLLENTLLGTSKQVLIAVLGPLASGTNVVYVGVTDTDPFNRVSLIESYDFDGMLLDDFTAGYVSAVPEPSSFVLAGIAATVILLRRRLLPSRSNRR